MKSISKHVVSIITPRYNVERYISAMIESVLGQTYAEWELLITDDCSTDGTVSIIKEYMLKDKRIKLYFTEQNTGHPSTPRNISLSHAQGDFITFLDSDDIWLPFKLEEQVSFMQKNEKCQLLNSYVQFISEEGVLLNRIVKTKPFATYQDMLMNYELTSPTIFCTRSVADKLRFPDCPQEDYIVWLEVTKRGVDIYNTQKIHA